MKKKIVILGAGISGLSAAWYLSSKHDVTVIEKESTPGGVLNYARVLKTSRSQDLLQMAKELNLKVNYTTSTTRYLWMNNKLVKFPKRKLLWPLLKEWAVKPCGEEETIWDFACRRFNKDVARYIFDPMVLGIFGGNIKELSVNACFPILKEWEHTHGSLTKAFFKREKQDPSLFSFEGGMQSLTNALMKNIPAKFCFNTEVNDFNIDADAVICSLPFPEIPRAHLTISHVHYAQDLALPKGFGYLVPSCEGEKLLGVIFDSPRQLTVISKEETDVYRKHLQIEQTPKSILVERQSIPQYTLGHQKRVELLQNRSPPNFHLIGNYLSGASVSDCVRIAKECADMLLY